MFAKNTGFLSKVICTLIPALGYSKTSTTFYEEATENFIPRKLEF